MSRLLSNAIMASAGSALRGTRPRQWAAAALSLGMVLSRWVLAASPKEKVDLSPRTTSESQRLAENLKLASTAAGSCRQLCS